MITVEPTFFLYYAVYIIVDSTNMNLLLQKKCRFSKISEPDLNTPCDDEKLGILYANEMYLFFCFIKLLFCTSCVIFATSWSDSAGRRRRPLIFVPVIGQIIQGLFGCLNSYFWSWSPLMAVLSYVVTEMMTGGISMVITASHMYICDVSSMESRTMRMGILMAARTIADFAGYGGSGFILRSLGFFHTYLVCFVLSFISLILALVFVKDTSVHVEKNYSLGEFFNVEKIAHACKTVFKKSLGRKRIIVIILLITHSTVFFAAQGEKGVLYLYLRYKFHWDERAYSSYVLYQYVGATIGGIFCSVVLSKLLKVHDGLIGIFAGICDTIAALGYLFADQNWQLYIVPLFDIFHGTAMSVSLSFMSKFYESDEFGRLNSVYAIFSLITPACHPVYNGIFGATLDTFPSAFFLLSVSLDTIVVFFYCAVYLLSRRLEQEVPKAAFKEEDKK